MGQAVDAGWRRYGLIEHHGAFASLRVDGRYRSLIGRMKSEVAVMRDRSDSLRPESERIATLDYDHDRSCCNHR